MQTLKSSYRLACAALALGSMVSLPAFADEFICTRSVGAISVDNLRVPDGRSCSLNGTRIKGNIVVGTGSTLNAGGIRVDGNVQAEGHRAVYLNAGTVVGGSVQLKQGGVAQVLRTSIDSDLQLESNRGRITVEQNKVDGNVQVVQNTGGVIIRRNQIAQALQCKQNAPAPTGGGNIAGDKEGQCARL